MNTSQMNDRRYFRLCLLALILAGCAQNDPLDLVPVQGVVTLDGQPLDRATVTFNPADGRPSIGRTDEKGVYKLQYTPQKWGALPGQHSVSIISEIESITDESTGQATPARKELLPLKYRDGSELSVSVDQKTKEYNFELKSK